MYDIISEDPTGNGTVAAHKAAFMEYGKSRYALFDSSTQCELIVSVNLRLLQYFKFMGHATLYHTTFNLPTTASQG